VTVPDTTGGGEGTVVGAATVVVVAGVATGVVEVVADAGGEVELGGADVVAAVVVTAVDDVGALLGSGSIGGDVADATTALSDNAAAAQPTSTTRPRQCQT
jgi:hypothetical protein